MSSENNSVVAMDKACLNFPSQRPVPKANLEKKNDPLPQDNIDLSVNLSGSTNKSPSKK